MTSGGACAMLHAETLTIRRHALCVEFLLLSIFVKPRSLPI